MSSYSKTHSGVKAKKGFRKSPYTKLDSKYKKNYSSSYKSKRSFMPQERNYVDIAQASYAMDTTGSITLLNTVAQGATVNQRIGKKFVMKSLQVRGYVNNNTNAIYNDCAWLIVYDKRPTGALPLVTDILVSANATSMNNDNNSGRFRILKREDFELIGQPIASAYTEKTAASADCFMKMNHIVVNKALGTGAIADIEEGALYLVTVGIAAAGNTAANAQLAFRIRFVEE